MRLAGYTVALGFLAFSLGLVACGGEKDTEGKTEAIEDKAAADGKPDKKPQPVTGPGNPMARKGPEKSKPGAEESAAQAPAKYAVELDTTKGKIVIDVTREWAPRGADRFFELVKGGYYTNVAFFRVIEGFMAQTGIHGDPAVNREWRAKRIKDDQVRESNTEGMVTFATSGRNSRTTQFFINFKDNGQLDGMGFAPFGKVRDMAVVNALFSGYGECAPRGQGPNQKFMHLQGNTYLEKEFPKIDYIKGARILEE